MSKRIDKNPNGAGQLLTLDGLPPCILQMATDGIWHVAAQFGAGEQEAQVPELPLEMLCQRAQHALGLAGIGSRIEDTYTAMIFDPTCQLGRFGAGRLNCVCADGWHESQWSADQSEGIH